MLKLTLTKKEEQVEIDEKVYTIRELGGKQRDAYMDWMGKHTKVIAGQVQGLTSYDGLQTYLLAMCLFDEHNDPVKESTMADWPSSTLSALWDMAQKLNGLSGEAIEEAKNA